MSMDTIPLPALFGVIIAVVLVACEAGYRLGGVAAKRSTHEKESPVSAISGSILGLTAFMMAFTFGIVSDRYDARKGLVREEANAIRTAWLRSDFLPEQDRGGAETLFRKYTQLRLDIARALDLDVTRRAIAESGAIQRRLWTMAVDNARKDMNSDVAALYIESLNEMTNLQAMRVAVGLQARIPTGIWLGLWALVVLGMLGMGYQMAIAGSLRSWSIPILAIAFSLVIGLIAALDRPNSRYIPVSHQPFADLLASMSVGQDSPPPGREMR